jgi:transposase
MAAHRIAPLRPLHPNEREVLEHMAHSQTESAVHVERAKILLAVNQGCSYAQAAHVAGRKSRVAVSNLVSQFNLEGVRALDLRHGGGTPIVYESEEQKKILDTFHTPPDRSRDGTATWSLTTLQARLRKDGMKQISTFTILKTLHAAGLSWQRNRTWVDTGKSVRMHKDGPVEVQDIDADAKKNSSRRPTRPQKSGAWIYSPRTKQVPFRRSRSRVTVGRP